MMNFERWQRLERLLEEALAQDPAARGDFLDAACEGDESLRHEVESLIASDAAAGRFLAEPVGGPGVDTMSDPGVLTGSRIGPYEVVRPIGRGGMGEVFLATRADDEYQQRVAIKVLRHPDAGEVARRFRVERQILAGFAHPGIARMLDGGTTETGQPYVVMEYVDGTPIDRDCDDRRLSIAARIECFRSVCDAVKYAHRNLVVHRDIKPANILVDAEGAPKLLDFGIAKLLDWRAEPSMITASGLRPMTPSYASPEQVRGEVITTASDVYSLGVLLYELVTGRLPYAVPDRPGAVEQVICETPATRPVIALTRAGDGTSEGGEAGETTAEAIAEARALRRSELERVLRSDLETILLKALRKSPEDRYTSVGELSEDLRRYRAGLPVVARRPTLRYRAARFLRRHRLGTALAAGLLVAAVGFAWSFAKQAARVTHERDRARHIADFLVEIFAASEPGRAQGSDPTASEILERGEARVAQLEAQPSLQADLMNTIGEVRRDLGDYQRAEPLLQQALAIRRTAGVHGLEIAESASALAGLLVETGDYRGAEALHSEALALRSRHLGDDDPMVAVTRADLAVALLSDGRQNEAEPLFREALAQLRRHRPADHAEVTETLGNLASTVHQMGRRDEAEALLREVLPLQRSGLGDRHPALARTLNNLAVLLRQGKEYEEAEAFLREALVIRRTVLGEDHPEVATTMTNLAAVLRFLDRDDEAEALYRQALELRRQTLGPGHPFVANSLHNLADLIQDRGDLVAAEPPFREAVAILEATIGLEHPSAAYSLVELGSLLTARGRPRDGEPFLRRAVSTRRAALPPGHWLTAWAENALGACLVASGRLDEAEAVLRSSAAIIDAASDADEDHRAQVRDRLEALAMARAARS